MEKRATAICDLPSDQFRWHSSRTMTDRCRNWTRMRQDENMPILLKTQVESADKTPVTVCRARVGGLCRFRSAAERVPAGSPKTGRCTAVRDRCGHGKRRKRTAAGEFQQREKPQAAKQDKAAGVVRAPRRSHLPAVRAVSGIYEGVVERAKIAPVGSQFEKSQTFQGKQRGCTKKVCRNRTNSGRCRGG